MSKHTFIEACYRRPTSHVPVWLMRQAGRYQPSYREVRKGVSFFDLCQNADLAAQVTINAVEEMNVDAGIIFSDILVPLRAMGAPVELTEAGPKLTPPIRTASDVDKLQLVDPAETMPFVMDAIRKFNAHFSNQVPLIGFAGGPITLAAYLVEGGHSRNFIELKKMLFCEPRLAHNLLEKLGKMVARHLIAQVEAGCHAVQVFDSWVGILSPDDFREFALPYTRAIFEELRACGVPRIYFGTDTSTLLEQITTIDAEVLGLDWRIDLDVGWKRIGDRFAVQGNLDPLCLLMDEPALEQRIQRILDRAAKRPGFIFNLGHGILPPTDPARVRFLVDTVHRLSKTAG
ncbi:MAG: uroporphyrinogen decarboxylase [Deltaproteobacteria bacterium]|nr:uroporphyrinogen decarboxylase [Deltaproteobacteria bacterium]